MGFATITRDICTVALAAVGVLVACAADDDNSKLDELGSTPRLRSKFEGKLDSWGEDDIRWDTGNKQLKFVMSRGGKAARLAGAYPILKGINLAEEWTIVVIARGTEKLEGDRMLWCLGNGAKGRSLALASSGRTGVKLVTWKDAGSDVKLLGMKNVVHFNKQYHVYSVVKRDGGPVQLWIDGKKAGEGEIDLADVSGEFRLGAATGGGGKPAGLEPGDGVDIDDFRVYDTALTEVSQLQLSSANQPWPEGLPKPKESISAFIDTNSVLRLGYEIPEQVVIGAGGEKRLYAKGVLAQCGIGGEKRFELNAGGQFALGSGGLMFDSNYARARTNEVVFSGGTLLSFEPTFVKSAAPIRLTGDFKIKALKQLAIRAGIEGDGTITKDGPGVLGLQYPCDGATGTLKIVSPSMLVLGPAATWGGKIELCKGAVLRCFSRSQVGKIVEAPGSKVVESQPERKYGESTFPQPTTAYNFKKLQKERMGRGVYAFRCSANQVMVGWRYKSSDPIDIAFNVYGNGRRLNSAPISDVTYFKTPWTGKATKYEVRWVYKGKEAPFSVSGSWTLPADAPIGYFDIELTPPPDTLMPDGKLARHIPCDCSIGDLDGDGEYELVIIWWPDNSADNSHDHKTGDTWLEGVKLDGTNRSLWKINLGPNIRSGSHYVPVMVCDMDGDGHAEVVCRTAGGTVDGKGRIQNDSGVFGPKNTFFDWRKAIPNNGHIVWAHNFVTVFDGRTGEAVDSVPFKPDVLSDPKLRAEAEERAKENKDQYRIRRDNLAVCREWPGSKRPGNPSYRMLGAVAYLDGIHPSVVMCRGYYSRTCLCAWDFDGKKLHERWFFCSDDDRWWGYGGQGFHNLRVADIDFDGKDEIIYGHMVVDHDGQGLYTTGMGHGDAIQLIQGSPEMRGLQLWTCHENSPYGVSLIDAQSGRLFFWKHGPVDTGTCNAMDTDPATPGVELFSSCNLGVYSASTLQELRKPRSRDAYYSTLRFGVWWNGDMTRSAYSGGTSLWNYSSTSGGISLAAEFGADVHSNHGTKGCPALAADILGDWREEIILARKDDKALRIFMSDADTPYRFHTFLEDPVYRISVLTQNNGYNMPTDPGFYFGPELLGHDIVFRGTRLK